jgi:hypothetical protein
MASMPRSHPSKEGIFGEMQFRLKTNLILLMIFLDIF